MQSQNSAKDGDTPFCQLPEREKHVDGIRAPRELEIQIRKRAVLSLGKYVRTERLI